MLKSRISLLALMLTLGTPVIAVAQEAAGTDAPAEAAAAPSDLSMGVSPDAAQPDDGTYTRATFEAWEQRCEKTGGAPEADPCQLYQLLKDSEGNNVAELAIFSLPEGTKGPAVAGANFIAPLETMLTEGLLIGVDTAKPRAYPFTVCTQIGCVARIGFTAEEIAGFKKGGKATFAITPFVAPDRKVALEVSLKGFTAGYDAMVAANKTADAAAAARAAQQPAAQQ